MDWITIPIYKWHFTKTNHPMSRICGCITDSFATCIICDALAIFCGVAFGFSNTGCWCDHIAAVAADIYILGNVASISKCQAAGASIWVSSYRQGGSEKIYIYMCVHEYWKLKKVSAYPASMWLYIFYDSLYSAPCL